PWAPRGSAMDLGRVGIWTFAFELQPAARVREAAAEIEGLGYGAIWIPEALGREALSHAAVLLAATRRIPVATGIANIWARDAMAMAAGQKTLAEAWPGRFLLGIGVSHAPIVGMRGHGYDRPLTFMRQYLDAMDAAIYNAPPPAAAPRVIGALAPKMLALAAERTEGAHPYFVPPDHTRRAPSRSGGRSPRRCSGDRHSARAEALLRLREPLRTGAPSCRGQRHGGERLRSNVCCSGPRKAACACPVSSTNPKGWECMTRTALHVVEFRARVESTG